MYSEIYLRLEPLGLERVAAALRDAGHELRLVDLQIFSADDLLSEFDEFKPHAVGFSLNYLANLPEVVDLAKALKLRKQAALIFVGGHSASFVAHELLMHGDGAIDCVVRGEGEAIVPKLVDAIGDHKLHTLPGVVTPQGAGPAPLLMDQIDRYIPARDLARRRWKYFIGSYDPCASIEFTRGCPWDCTFCSAWTFYGRSYRQASPEAAADDLESIKEPNAFIVDDVAFIHPEHATAIGREIERRGIKKKYYLETRADVLCRNREVFEYWYRLGLRLMFIGLEAMDDEGLKLHRKRSRVTINESALEIARKIGLTVAVNLIVDPDWDEAKFAAVRDWAMSVEEVVHLTVATPYPGTETWFTDARQLATDDYRLFDIQHAVMPTRLPLERFYKELVATQQVLNRKHLGVRGLWQASSKALRLLANGQTNFIKMLWKFNSVYNPERQYQDHLRPVKYALRLPETHAAHPAPSELYIHQAHLNRASLNPTRRV
jgi:magnesium-protoporphyrin IX monomethyl ester (oxidative) cyclase